MGWIGEGMRTVVEAFTSMGHAGERSVILLTVGLVIHLGGQIHHRLASSNNRRPYDSILKEVSVAKESEARCGICSKQLSAAVSLPCQHVFHRNCIRGSLEHKASCPTCRCPYDDFIASSEY